MSKQKTKEYVGENTFEVYVISELKVIRQMVETTQKQVEDLNKDLKARTIQNGNQDVSLAKLNTVVKTHDEKIKKHDKNIEEINDDYKKLAWKIGFFIGGISILINLLADKFL